MYEYKTLSREYLKTMSTIANGEPAMPFQSRTTPSDSHREQVPVTSSATILAITVTHPITSSMSANMVTFTSAGFLTGHDKHVIWIQIGCFIKLNSLTITIIEHLTLHNKKNNNHIFMNFVFYKNINIRIERYF